MRDIDLYCMCLNDHHLSNIKKQDVHNLIDLVLSDLEVLQGIHYASTLKEWKNRFIRNKDRVIKTYSESFYRLWLYYLSGCEAAFRWADQCNFQILLDKDINIAPRTRDYIYS